MRMSTESLESYVAEISDDFRTLGVPSTLMAIILGIEVSLVVVYVCISNIVRCMHIMIKFNEWMHKLPNRS